MENRSRDDAPPFFDRRRVLSRLAPSSERGLLAGMRIRKKLVVLHTVFSLVLAGILLVALRPAVQEVVRRAEVDEAVLLLDAIGPALAARMDHRDLLQHVLGDVSLESGTATELGLDAETAARAAVTPGRAVSAATRVGHGATLMARVTDQDRFFTLSVRNAGARAAVTQLYVLVVIALLAVYGLVALALEVFVLPRGVYQPIRRMLAADRAVQEGRQESEIIPASAIPADELGEIMASRNESVLKLRRQEAALADALGQLETVATDLRRKNHLLENARRNMVESDRLASLGMMSAGISHELNTPLAVLKGLVEKLAAEPGVGVESARAALMLRVVQRLERLGESLLDFARARTPQTRPADMRGVVDEALTLVRLDREASGVECVNVVDAGVVVECDSDRMVQVFVNLVRNGVDAVRAGGGKVTVDADMLRRDGREWVSLRVQDDGPGIDAAILPRLFEPFASTRLDARGTGLGLAVAEGIVREHGGVLLARNRTDGPGAVFELMMPRGSGEPRARASVAVLHGASHD